MNKFFNALLFVIFIPTMLLTIVVGFDVPLSFIKTSGANLEYRKEALLVLGVFLLIVNIRRAIKRWVALRLVNQTSKFKWNSVVSKNRSNRVVLYNFLEALILFCAGYGLFAITEFAWMPFIGLAFGALDAIVFAIYGSSTHKFRAGITKKALVAGDRDVVLIYFKGLRRVSLQQQTLFFDFKDDLQLRFPIDMVPEENRDSFFSELKNTVNKKLVYFSNNI